MKEQAIKSPRGGARPGAGQPKKDNPKRTVTIRMRDDQKSDIVKHHGSLQKGVDWLAEQSKPQNLG